MKEKTKEWIIPFFEAYDFSEVKTLVEVGGSMGILTAVILKLTPKMKAILFHREDVVVRANQVLEGARVVDRRQIVGGNFFDSVPRGGALYLLSRVFLNTE
jgi:hypothetical protein